MLRRAIKSAVNAAGYDIRKRNDPLVTGLDKFFPLLKRLGFRPQHIVDVGANHGHWTRAAVRYFPLAKYTLIEPQDFLKDKIRDLTAKHNIRWISVGCSDAAGDLPFAVAEHDHSSTFLTDTQKASITLPVKTLDSLVTQADMIKIDAEGYDLKVLRGAQRLFGKTDVFLVEAMVLGHYQNTVHAVTGFMTEAGYSLFDITDINRSHKTGAFWTTELAFVRNASKLLAAGKAAGW